MVATSSSAVFGASDAENPSIRIPIASSSWSDQNRLSSGSITQSEDMSSQAGEPIAFFQDSGQQDPFEPVRLAEISNALNSTEGFRRLKTPVPLATTQKSHPKHRVLFRPTFVLKLLNGCIGVILMTFTLQLLSQIGESYSYCFFHYQREDTLSPALELIRWCGFFLWLIGSYLLVSSFFELIPHVLMGFTFLCENEKFCEELAHILRLRSLMVLFFVCLFSVFLANRIFSEPPPAIQTGPLGEGVVPQFQRHGITWQFLLRRTTIAIACIIGILTIEKWVIQRISISFHRLNYRDRIQENNFKMAVLMTLKKFALAHSKIPFSQAFTGLFAHITGMTLTFSPLEEAETSSHKARHNMEECDLDQYQEEAALLATKIFASIRHAVIKEKGKHVNKDADLDMEVVSDDGEEDISNGYGKTSFLLKQEDFNVIFANSSDVTEAFRLLDQNDSGDISVQELTNYIISTFKERGAILKSLAENKSIIRQLDWVILVLASVPMFALVLQIFELPTSSFAAFGTIFFGLSFVFGKLASTLLYSVVFVLLSHPYDVGDRVSFDSYDGISVSEIGILSTVFIDKDGRSLYIQNRALFDKPIYNIRRSLPQTETISLSFNIDASSMENICILKEALAAFFEENSRDYCAIDNWFKPSLESKSSLRIDIVAAHRSNFQDVELKQRRSEKLSLFLMDKLRELGLH